MPRFYLNEEHKNIYFEFVIIENGFFVLVPLLLPEGDVNIFVCVFIIIRMSVFQCTAAILSAYCTVYVY